MSIPFNKFLTNDGLAPSGAIATANYNARGNYAVSTDFYYTVPAGLLALVHEFRVGIEDTGSLDSASYGNGITLTGTDGILVQVQTGAGTPVNDLTEGVLIQKNLGWRKFGTPENVQFGTGNEVIIASFRAPAPIEIPAGYRLAVRLKGDFTGLVEHAFVAGGVFKMVQ